MCGAGAVLTQCYQVRGGAVSPVLGEAVGRMLPVEDLHQSVVLLCGDRGRIAVSADGNGTAPVMGSKGKSGSLEVVRRHPLARRGGAPACAAQLCKHPAIAAAAVPSISCCQRW